MEVQTAGLAHHPGGRVAEAAIIVMRELGIDISGARSKPVTEADVGWADFIVTVQDDHADYLIEEFQVTDSKIRRLKPDVQDPYCGPIEKYRETRNELSGHLSRLVDSLGESTP